MTVDDTAAVDRIGGDDITAPALLWMHRPAARVVAAIFIAATLLSLPNYRGDNHSLVWLIVAVTIVSLGIAAMMATRIDPMPLRTSIAAAASVALSALITALALPGLPANPNQLNALGAGAALCAFMCVRGRVMTAWLGHTAALAIMTAWGHWTGLGASTGFQIGLPNLAVLAMATMFASVMRPAARQVGEQRARAVRERAEITESKARDAEETRQNTKLAERAWPSIVAIAGDEPLTAEQVRDITLTGMELRDSIRSPLFDTSEIVAAARGARARGVEVELLDDKGMHGVADATVATFLAEAAQWLSEAADGTITVRAMPPHRNSLGTIVATTADGELRELTIDAEGRRHLR